MRACLLDAIEILRARGKDMHLKRQSWNKSAVLIGCQLISW
jgi:hypothetical protein